jgi:hypothetical protein
MPLPQEEGDPLLEVSFTLFQRYLDGILTPFERYINAV